MTTATRVRTQIASSNPVRTNKIQRDRVTALLEEVQEIRATFDGTQKLDNPLVAALDLLAAALQRSGGNFAVGLSSVGNPDFGQYCGRGVMSPTCVIYADTVEETIQLCTAYISVFNLGGGNCPDFPVLTRAGGKLRVSYNGRLWQNGADGAEEEIAVGNCKTAAQHEAEGWKDYRVSTP